MEFLVIKFICYFDQFSNKSSQALISICFLTGEVIKIVCIALGFPIPRVTWMKNMHELKKQTKYASWSEKRTILIKDKKIIGKVFAVLTLKAQLQDVLVGCKAYNSAGKASARAHLRVHNPPRSPCKKTFIFFILSLVRSLINCCSIVF